MNTCCTGSCGKVIGALRILLGIAMLYFGLMKLGMSAEMHTMVGSAAHKFGLTFFSTETWFWIATTGEILAGLWLLLGHAVKGAAVLTIVIMIFALNATGWMEPKAWAVLVVALVVFIRGPGARCRACGSDNESCGDGMKSCCGGVCKESNSMKQGVESMQAGAATMAAGAVATASGVVEKAKDAMETVKDVAGNVVEKADTLVDHAKDMAAKAKDLVEQTGSDAATKVVETAEAVLDKAGEVLDSAKETVEKVAAKIDDTQKDA